MITVYLNNTVIKIPHISKELMVLICISLVLVGSIISYFIQLNYSKNFIDYGISVATVTNINTNKGGVSGYTYHVSGIKYYGTSGYSKKFNVGEKYHLIYSIKDPKYSIIIWDIPINAELNREDVNIEAYIGIGKQRISKGIIDYDL